MRTTKPLPRQAAEQRIVSNGARRLQTNAAFQTRLRELRESIDQRYAAELARAGFFRRLILQWRMEAEYRREKQKIVPSLQALYVSHFQSAARMIR